MKDKTMTNKSAWYAIIAMVILFVIVDGWLVYLILTK